MKLKMNDSIELLIKSRQGLVYNGKVKNLSSINEEGKFDILPKHANFISLIRNLISFTDNSDQKKEIKITVGLLRVKENKIEVYLGI